MKKILILLIAAVLSACANHAPLPTVAGVDAKRYMGDWYEIGKLPNRFQKQCVANTIANYQLVSPTEITVTNICQTPDGKTEKVIGVAHPVDGSNNTKLRVSFFRPFYGNYWVLDLGANYEWVLVGEPSRDYAWVLSRTPQLPDAVYAQLLAKASSLGFNDKAFEKTPQTSLLQNNLPAKP